MAKKKEVHPALQIYTKEYIQERLMNDPKWIARALKVLWEDQTDAEKMRESTHVENGVGFSKVDASFLSSIYNWYNEKKYLTTKQQYKTGIKLKKYWKQIQNKIVQKARVAV